MMHVAFSGEYERIVGEPFFLANCTSDRIKRYFDTIGGFHTRFDPTKCQTFWCIDNVLSKNLYDTVKEQQPQPRPRVVPVAPPKPPRKPQRSPRLCQESISQHNQLQARGFNRRSQQRSPRKISGGYLMNNGRQKST